jgi:hypothetical protein
MKGSGAVERSGEVQGVEAHTSVVYECDTASVATANTLLMRRWEGKA